MVLLMRKRKTELKILLTIILISIIYIFKANIYLGNNLEIDKNILNLDYKKRYDEIKKNYDLLKEEFNFIPAQVTNLSINKINNLFMINKGTIDGVTNNSFVINSEGLVGIIKKSFKKKSLVELVTSGNIKLSIETNECYGTLIYKNKHGIIRDLVNCSGVSIGDNVYTSKYNYSDANILIGKIIKIEKDKLYIKYEINPYKIKYVGVISDNIWSIFK